MRGTLDLPADIPSRCAAVRLYLCHNFRELDLFRSSGTEILDGVTNADEAEKERFSHSLFEWRQLTVVFMYL
jgi:hypothetical protein